MKIKPKDTNIKTILESSFLTIPRFQRPYSWDKENISDFWNDIILSKDDDYFIGSMVLFRDNESSSDAFVVDGQQRLMTITVFFAAIRDVFLEMKENDYATGLQRIIERRDINNKHRFTLVSEDPYPFFQHQIQTLKSTTLNTEISDEEKNIQATYHDLLARVQEHVEPLSKTRRIKTLQAMRDRVLSVKVITIDLDNEDDAYLIFETLNTRGKDLTVSDLVKNHLTKLLRATNTQSDQTREKWRQIQRTIGRSLSDIDIDSFIVHHWISRYEYLPERRLFKSLRNTIKKASASGYLDELYNESSLYRGIFEPSFLKLTKQESDIFHSLRAIALFRLRQAAPFVLALLSEYKKKKVSLKNASTFLKAIENFHFKFTAVTSQRGAGGVAMMYSRAARDLRAATTEQNKRKVCLALCGRFDSMQPDAPEFYFGWSQVFYSRVYQNQRPLVRYILEKVHRHYNKGKDPIDYSSMTIEHILPQDDGNKSEETKASIGNLVFVSEELNGKLKNKSFKEKKKLLLGAGIKLDPVLASATSWGEKEIDKRTAELSVVAYDNIWAL